jgi:hypothetical protein
MEPAHNPRNSISHVILRGALMLTPLVMLTNKASEYTIQESRISCVLGPKKNIFVDLPKDLHLTIAIPTKYVLAGGAELGSAQPDETDDGARVLPQFLQYADRQMVWKSWRNGVGVTSYPPCFLCCVAAVIIIIKRWAPGHRDTRCNLLCSLVNGRLTPLKSRGGMGIGIIVRWNCGFDAQHGWEVTLAQMGYYLVVMVTVTVLKNLVMITDEIVVVVAIVWVAIMAERASGSCDHSALC